MPHALTAPEAWIAAKAWRTDATLTTALLGLVTLDGAEPPPSPGLPHTTTAAANIDEAVTFSPFEKRGLVASLGEEYVSAALAMFSVLRQSSTPDAHGAAAKRVGGNRARCEAADARGHKKPGSGARARGRTGEQHPPRRDAAAAADDV